VLQHIDVLGMGSRAKVVFWSWKIGKFGGHGLSRWVGAGSWTQREVFSVLEKWKIWGAGFK
jgi:hypothetical protein